MTGKYQTLNINFNNDNAKSKLELEKVNDITMESFSVLVGQQLYNAEHNKIIVTNANVKEGKTLFTCAQEIPDLVKILRDDHNYFKINNISKVRILSNEDFTRMMRKNEHIDEMSKDYIMNHIPRMKDLIAKDEQSKQIFRDDRTGDYLTHAQIRKRELDKQKNK